MKNIVSKSLKHNFLQGFRRHALSRAEGFTHTPSFSVRKSADIFNAKGGRDYLPCFINTKKLGVTSFCEGGFTLVELMVSIGIFIFILSATMGALLSIVSVYRKTQTLHIVSDNINLALEDISRNLVQGTNFHCDKDVGIVIDPRSCSDNNGAQSMVFQSNDEGKQVTYWLDTTSNEIMKDVFDGVTTVTGKLTTGSVVRIDELRFRVFAGEGVGNNDQPRVIINIRGTAVGKDDTASSFEVQTTAVQRTPKLP